VTIEYVILICPQYLVSSWYTKEERGKRVALFYCTASLAGMFSGYLQAGAYKGLDGTLGKEGWQVGPLTPSVCLDVTKNGD